MPAPALPPGAILCVRRLHAHVATMNWDGMLRARLADAAAHALRPRAGEWLPASTEALVFDDRSHLLACLAGEWLAGRTQAWWWACLVPGKDFAALMALWGEHPQSVPTALVHLDAIRQSAAFVGAMPEETVRSLLVAVAVTFGLNALVEVVRSEQVRVGPFSPAFPAQNDEAPKTRRPVAADRELETPGPAREPVGTMPDSTPPKPVEPPTAATPNLRAVLIDVARTLQTKPARLQDPKFVRELLYAARVSPGRAHHLEKSRPAARPLAGRTPREDDTRYQEARADENPAQPQAPVEAPPWPAAPTMRSPGRESPDEVSEIEGRPHARSPLIDDEPANGPFQVHTRYGGLFFLVNLFVYRGLYADFDAPMAPGLPVELYDVLALAGLALWGEPFRDDALWPLLAMLAARAPEDEPGADVSPEALGAPSVEAWFVRIWAELRADLFVALEVELAGDVTLAALFRRAARIHVTPTRLDVIFALDDLELAFRRSRLDRDPGWIPAARREIRFHFE